MLFTRDPGNIFASLTVLLFLVQRQGVDYQIQGSNISLRYRPLVIGKTGQLLELSAIILATSNAAKDLDALVQGGFPMGWQAYFRHNTLNPASVYFQSHSVQTTFHRIGPGFEIQLGEALQVLQGIQDAALVARYNEESSIEIILKLGDQANLTIELVSVRKMRLWEEDNEVDESLHTAEQ